MALVWIALGGALGALARLGIDAVADVGLWSTLVINIFGSLGIGVLLPWLIRSDRRARFIPFLITGVLGGFTTFSAFAAETVELLDTGQAVVALGYVAFTLAAGIGAVFLGQRLVRRS